MTSRKLNYSIFSSFLLIMSYSSVIMVVRSSQDMSGKCCTGLAGTRAAQVHTLSSVGLNGRLEARIGDRVNKHVVPGLHVIPARAKQST